ncbi:MAG: histidine kinase N-terminal 7TM domain-containing protein [Anaerolineae bacterium]
MSWQHLFYPMALFVAAMVSAIGAVLAWRRQPTREAPWLALIQIAASEWALCAGFRALASDLSGALFWARLSYLGVVSISVFQLLFVITFAHLSDWLTRPMRLFLWFIPLVTLGMVFTNSRHHLMWSGFTLSPSPISRMYLFHPGPWFWVAVIYFYILNLVSSAILVWVTLRRRDIYRRQALTLLLSYPLPWLANLFYVFTNASLKTGYDYTPLTFTFGGVMLLWGFYRYHLLEIIPVARDALIETMTDGVVVLDLENRIVDLNAASEQLLGSASQVLGRTLKAVSPRCAEILAMHPEDEEAYGEICIDERTPRYLDLRISPLFDAGGARLGRLVVWRDITKRKLADAQLVRQQRELATLAERERLGRALHDDLGQVMGYINVQSQAALTFLEQKQGAEVQKILHRLVEVAQEAHDKLREYILGVRADDEVDSLDFFVALKKYLMTFQRRYGVHVEVIRPPDLPQAFLSSDAEAQLLRILQEALMNVYKHAEVESARILFNVEGHGINVVVSDEGRGLEPAEVGDEGRFGLNIMRERAEAVQGRFEIHSRPGRGTQVSVWLPRRMDVGERGNGNHSLANLRVVLVDDHPLFLDGLRNMLTAYGLQVVGVGRDGYEAQALVRSRAPDLVLMDIQMPRCDGLEALQQIRRLAPETKVVMLTVAAEEEQLFDALLSGASGYLLKNLESAAFFELLMDVMRGEVVLSPGLAAKALVEAGLKKRPSSEAERGPGRDGAASDLHGLTRRQYEVLRLVAEGMTYKEVALKLHLSESTIKYHMGRILEQLQLENRRAAVVYARRRGLGELD